MPHKNTLPLIILLHNFLVSLSQSIGSPPEIITIGGVLSSKIAQNEFEKSVNNLNLLNGRINLHFNSTSIIMDPNPIQSAIKLCDNVVSQGVQVMVVSHPPGGDSQPPISVSYTCGFYQIPVIGISARDSAFSDKNVHPTFLRTVPPYFHQADVWLELLKHYGWKKVIFIHSMDEEGRMILSRFQALAEKEDISVEETIKYEAGDNSFESLLTAIPSFESRVILLSATKEDAENIFEEASKRSLLGEGYVWIVSEQAMKATNVPVNKGALGLELFNATAENVHIKDAVTIIGKTIRSLFKNDNLTTVSDVSNSCKNRKSSGETSGKIIYRGLLKERLDNAITGQITFNNDGDRLNPIYYFKNRQPMGIVPVGYFGNKEAMVPALDISDNITWPGNINTKPKGLNIVTHLEVVTLEAKPFVHTRLRSEGGPCGTDEDKFELPCNHVNMSTNVTTEYCCWGYCMEMLREISQMVNFTYDVHISHDKTFGSFEKRRGSKTKQWNGMVGELVSKQADLIVAPLTINPERANYIDFSKPFKYQGLIILVKKTAKSSNLASFLQPFQDTLWILVGLSVHVVALVLYLLDRFSPFGRFKLAKSDDTEEDALNLSSAMWFAWGVLLNSGIGEGTPRSFSARVLGMVWAGFAMIIVASYTANLAAFLVLDRPEASITGIDDARLRNPNENFNYSTVKNSAVEMYSMELSTFQKTEHLTAEDAIDAVRNNKLDAFIWDSSRLEYEAAKDCDLIVAGELFGRSGLGVGLQKRSPWTHDISMAILGLHEKGKMEQLDNDWILKESSECPLEGSAPATLGLTNMAGVFMMVAGGIVAGVFLIFVEITYKRYRGLKEKELELARNAADRWRGNIEKRRTLRQTLQRQRDEQFAAIPINMKGIPLNTNDGSNSSMHGEIQGETHYPGKRLSYTEATGSKLYSPPTQPSLPSASSQSESRSVTINNPAYGDIMNQDDNFV
ncbi:GRIN1 [Mytilus edulis]|uniref:Glutamate [NMDA] receptor subunit 1 n=1 Tax=Mytilus edulis TaxID=6550 RepID=A0A8S3S720_MYTED|nr:GRIN1 [Mytilus edulis]